MGAVMNMRPDLFKAVVANVPFVDVINTMLDASLPLTTGEYEEWGNPNDKKYYDYMKSYAPYENIEKKAYPNLLMTTGLNDSQVPYWEPTKFAAKLRTMKTDNNVLMMKIDMGVGHGGASGRFDALKDRAFEYAFMMKMVGITQ
jgi:oligopeptidase B